jgi:hypothetical protein
MLAWLAIPGWGLSLASPAPDGLAAVRHLA